MHTPHIKIYTHANTCLLICEYTMYMCTWSSCTHTHTYAMHTCTHSRIHTHIPHTGPCIHVHMHMCIHNPHPTPTRHAAYTLAHILTYPHLCLCNHVCIHTCTSTPCTYTHTCAHPHPCTTDTIYTHADLCTALRHAICLSPGHIYPAHTPTQVHTAHTCTHTHAGLHQAHMLADIVHTVNPPMHDPLCTHPTCMCIQELMPAHTQAALLGSLIFWSSEDTSGHQVATISNRVPAAAYADALPVLGQCSTGL